MNTKQEKKIKRDVPLAADYLFDKEKNKQSPHARGEQKRRACIDWLYRWGYSSGPVLTRVSGAQQAIAGKLVKAKLVVATRTEAGGVTKGTPAFYYTLTESGQEEAERLTEQLLRCPEVEDRYRVNQQQLRHYLMAQMATINALDSNTVVSYETERQIDEAGDKIGIKRPDVVWTLPAGKKIGIEVELSAKWDRKLDDFILGIARSLKINEVGLTRFERVTVVTDSPAIEKRYKAAMQPGQTMHIWKKNDRQHWTVEKSVQVPEWLIERVDFVLLAP